MSFGELNMLALWSGKLNLLVMLFIHIAITADYEEFG